MSLTEALKPQQQAAKLIFPTKHTLNGVEAFLEDVSIEQRFPAPLHGFPAPGIGIDVGHHAAVEDRLPVLPAIVTTVQADDRSTKVKADRTRYSHHVWQGCTQKWRLTVVPGSGDKWRDDVAVAVAEGHDLIAFDLLVAVETDVVATLLRRCRGAVAVDDGHVEKVALMKPQHYDRENDIETATGLPASKGAINSRVVDLGAPFGVVCNRQLLPLTSQIQQFQDVVEYRMQRQLRWRTAAPHR